MERLLARLERRLGRYAPENLALWIVGLSGAEYLLLWLQPGLYNALVLDPRAVAKGEVWRVFTFLFMPWRAGGGGLDPISTLFALWLLYTFASALEAQWGSFKFLVYYLLGALGTLVASLFVGSLTNEYLSLSLVLAFATLFPDYEILLMFLLPVKMRWVGLLAGAGLVVALLFGSLPTKAGVLVALGNYLLFFGPSLLQRIRGARIRRGAPVGHAAFARMERAPRVCAKCGRSEADDPALEFRVCDCRERCQGRLTEYCLEHARAH